MLSNWLRALCLLLLSSAVAACTGSPDNRDVDTKSVALIVSHFSTFLAAGDTTGLATICASEFVLLEEGELYDVHALKKSISNILSAGTMKRQLSDIHIKARGDAAWCWYRVSGEYRSMDKSIPLTLLETMVLERPAKKWQIVQVCTMQAATKSSS
jgi:hypothetical protein